MTGKEQYTVALVGNPNVGKSVLFYNLTKTYASVSNYPGTTVSLTNGKMNIGSHHEITVVDTPGFYNLVTITEEERVTKKILMEDSPDAVVHVIDAKNIERMLPQALQLIEAGFPMILVLNMFDELKYKGIDIQISHLEHDLGIPVLNTVATKGEGVANLRSRIVSVAEKRYNYDRFIIEYEQWVEDYIDEVMPLLKESYGITSRSLALLILQNDQDAFDLIINEEHYDRIKSIVSEIDHTEIGLSIAQSRHSNADEIIKENLTHNGGEKKETVKKVIDKVTMHPVMGLFAVAFILYFGFYLLVGKFGAGVLVDIIETGFEAHATPFIDSIFHKLFGTTVFFNLFAGDYGIFTFGLRYAVAIVLPVVATFFLMFSLLEDSGYLVRLSMLLDRMLKTIGLSGRSVIPMILGLGCGTMATVVTRTLETVRERYIVTFLLALTVPCSAQLGVILALLSGSFKGLLVWLFTILIIFILAGFALNKFVKGEKASFFMEVPPIRFPKPGNVIIKTVSRLKWYAMEVIPIFMFVSVLIWVGKLTGLFEVLTGVLEYPAAWAGLPKETSEVLLYGFFRRDFGAAGLYDMKDILSIKNMVVASVILTLFVPCVAQLGVMIKERGLKAAMFIFVVVVFTAFAVGSLLNVILNVTGIL